MGVRPLEVILLVEILQVAVFELVEEEVEGE